MMPTFHPAGDAALSVQFGTAINPAANAAVIALSAALDADPILGVTETVPTYRSLLILYDPTQLRATALQDEVLQRLAQRGKSAEAGRLWHVPVHYGGPAALDLATLAAEKSLTVPELIELHQSAEYRVYMIGFAPGFAYLGGLPDALHTPRLQTPRQMVPAGAIGIGGRQASINSVAGPSGWRFIGATPVRAFDPRRDDPFLFAAGDRIHFTAVSEDEARAIAARIDAGEPVVQPRVPA